MQGDDRLAGARAALDDEHAGLRRADDLVLLGLDRGDDVAERAGAAALERGEQRRVAAQLGPSPSCRLVRHEAVVVADAEVAAAEQLVLDAEDGAALDGEVAAAHEAHRLAAGGPVERLGDRRPPVDDDRLGLLVGDGEAADVEALGGRRASRRSRSMRPNTSAASPRSRSVSRLTRASSNALRSKRAWNVPPRSASCEVAQPPRRRPWCARGTRRRDRRRPARRRVLGAAGSFVRRGSRRPRLGDRIVARRRAADRSGSGGRRTLSAATRRRWRRAARPIASAAPCDRPCRRSWPPRTARSAPHTPVWFMRQAGRSLPEYRAVRGEGSILDAIKQPDLAAEITLQPVRRYGVDAAVLYSDIVVPGPRRRLRHRRRARHRAGRRDAAARPGRPRPPAPARARRHRATSPRPSSIVAAELGRRRAGARLRRRAVHRRQLPRSRAGRAARTSTPRR